VRRGFEDFEVSVGRATGFNFGFDGVGGVEIGLGIEEVTGVLALGRGIESEDITRGRGLLESMVDDGQVVGGNACRKKAARRTRSSSSLGRPLIFPRNIVVRLLLSSAAIFPPNCYSRCLLWPRETHYIISQPAWRVHSGVYDSGTDWMNVTTMRGDAATSIPPYPPQVAAAHVH